MQLGNPIAVHGVAILNLTWPKKGAGTLWGGGGGGGAMPLLRNKNMVLGCILTVAWPIPTKGALNNRAISGRVEPLNKGPAIWFFVRRLSSSQRLIM